MDVIALRQAGFGGAVAPLGTALTEEQLEELWRLSPAPMLCFDGDAAGARAAARAAELALPLLAPERTLKLATLPAGEDPDTLVRRQGAAGFQAVLDAARPLADALYDLLREAGGDATPEQRAAFRTRLDQAARRIPDKALAGEYRERAARPVLRRSPPATGAAEPADRPRHRFDRSSAAAAAPTAGRVGQRAGPHPDRDPAAPSGPAARRGARLCRRSTLPPPLARLRDALRDWADTRRCP